MRAPKARTEGTLMASIIHRNRTGDRAAPANYRITEVRFSVVREAAAPPRAKLDTPALVGHLARQVTPDDAREHFGLFLLDQKNQLVAYHHVSTGTLSSSLVHPREVIGPALRVLGVAAIVLFHTTRAEIRRRAPKTSSSRASSSSVRGSSTSRSTTT